MTARDDTFVATLVLLGVDNSAVVSENLTVVNPVVPPYDVIIGRDVLRTCLFFYDGPRGVWAIKPVKTITASDYLNGRLPSVKTVPASAQNRQATVGASTASVA
ncbi:MAG TPA: hypothetical protein VM737_02510 [Gemmatimonadota bacterium]|nr:hypothetical protein [Gemmatimonadota bacterium]